MIRQCAELAASRTVGAVLCVNMMTEGQFDRDVLTRRFVSEIVPRQIGDSVRGVDLEPMRSLRLSFRALPRMREFGAELKDLVTLMPVHEFVALLRSCGHEPAEVDQTALWGQTTSLAVQLPTTLGQERKIVLSALSP